MVGPVNGVSGKSEARPGDAQGRLGWLKETLIAGLSQNAPNERSGVPRSAHAVNEKQEGSYRQRSRGSSVPSDSVPMCRAASRLGARREKCVFRRAPSSSTAIPPVRTRLCL